MSKILEDLNWRYAVKKFDSTKKITDAEFQLLKESIRLTPTSYGLQTFKVLVIESAEIREKLVEASYGQRQVLDASHLFVLCAQNSVSDLEIDTYINLISKTRNAPLEALEGFSNGMKGSMKAQSEQAIKNWSERQMYIILGQLLHTCASLRIDATPMEGFDPSKYNEILGLSEKNLTATLVCPVGYRHVEDAAQHGLKVRKSLDDLIETI